MFEDKKNKQNLPPQPPANLPIKDMLDEIDEVPVQTITKTEPLNAATTLAPLGGQENRIKFGLAKFKGLAIGGAALVVLVLLVFGLYSFFSQKNKSATISNDNAAAATTEDTENEATLPSDVLPSGNTAAASQVDSDLDGLTDEEEKVLGTDPQKTDSDNDELSDREEVKIYQTNPLNNDTDGDGFMDGVEVKNGYDPKGTGKLFVLPANQN